MYFFLIAPFRARGFRDHNISPALAIKGGVKFGTERPAEGKDFPDAKPQIATVLNHLRHRQHPGEQRFLRQSRPPGRQIFAAGGQQDPLPEATGQHAGLVQIADHVK